MRPVLAGALITVSLLVICFFVRESKLGKSLSRTALMLTVVQVAFVALCLWTDVQGTSMIRLSLLWLLPAYLIGWLQLACITVGVVALFDVLVPADAEVGLTNRRLLAFGSAGITALVLVALVALLLGGLGFESVLKSVDSSRPNTRIQQTAALGR